jgi:preprotein translocase subunit YajC
VHSALAFQNVQPNIPAGGSPAAAPGNNPGNSGTSGITVNATPAPAGPAPSQPSPFVTLLPFLLIVPFFFMMFRRNKKEQDARKGLKKGDRIASQSGLVGELVDLDERFAKVKLGPGNTVTMLASSIQPLDPGPAAKAESKDLAADKK